MMTWFSEATDPLLFHCPCKRTDCDAPDPSVMLLARLELTRDFYGQPMTVTSGVRCRAHNVEVKGEDPSEHLDGDGADIAVANSHARYKLRRAALASGFTRFGTGPDFLHLGCSPKTDVFPPEVEWTYYPKKQAAVPVAAR